MSTATVQRLTHVVMIAAALAACVMAQGALAAPAVDPKAAEVVVLPRVEVIGKRVAVQPAAQQVVHLPRVTITARRLDATDPVQARVRKNEGTVSPQLVAMR